ncbi:MAG TPA: arylamine N-acetyltransferase [Rhodanobacteraceae bacterium]|nr:arylamine N-acetyltransferase [Rhodanobacteraceae bacterium]
MKSPTWPRECRGDSRKTRSLRAPTCCCASKPRGNHGWPTPASAATRLPDRCNSFFDIEQAKPHEPFRLVRHDDGDWRLQLFAADAWQTLYRFTLQPQFPADYRISNYWTSTNPGSHFVTGLTAARALAGRRLTLRNREFAVHPAGGATQRRSLHDAREIRTVLEHEFLIRLPVHPSPDHRLDALPE